MSKIDELIAEHCSNGIEFQDLNKVATIKRGVRVTKKDLLEDGAHPVVSGGIGYMGYINEYNREAETITIAQYGTAGFVKWQTRKFWANDVCFSVIPNLKVIDNKYLYYFLADKQEYLYGISNRNAVPYSIDKEKILKIKIPLPPLEVQREVVKVLDKFTQLEAELSAELDARRKQYKYYRNQLLTFGETDESVEWRALGDVATVKSGKNKKRTTESEYPVFGSTGIIGYSDQYAYEGKALLVARVGAYAGQVNRVDGMYDVSDNTLMVKLRDDCSYEYFYHLLVHMNLNQYASGGGQPLVTAGKLKELRIPVPDLSEQSKIAETLDQFYKLTNDISEGLPAEISARHKQYGYYRNKLLKLMELQSV